jgi:hypothetical protein
MNNHIMLDLETLGTRPGSVMLSIGAVAFGPDGLGSELHVIISRDDSLSYGLVEDPSTMRWWQDRSPEARKTLDCANNRQLSVPLLEALKRFETLCILHGGPKEVRVWGNGADFDQPILSEAWHRSHTNLPTPWRYINSRCYRTLKSMRPHIHLLRTGVHHNALDDAKSQASHAILLLNDTNGWDN